MREMSDSDGLAVYALAYELQKRHPSILYNQQLLNRLRSGDHELALGITLSGEFIDLYPKYEKDKAILRSVGERFAIFYFRSDDNCSVLDFDDNAFVEAYVAAERATYLSLQNNRLRYINAGLCAEARLILLANNPDLERAAVIATAFAGVSFEDLPDETANAADIRKLLQWHPFLYANTVFKGLQELLYTYKNVIFIVTGSEIISVLENTTWKLFPADFERYRPSFGLDGLKYVDATLVVQYFEPCAFVYACNSGFTRVIINAPNCYGNVFLAKNSLTYCDISMCTKIKFANMDGSKLLSLSNFIAPPNIEIQPDTLFLDQIPMFRCRNHILHRFPRLRHYSVFGKLAEHAAAGNNCIFVVTTTSLLIYLTGNSWLRKPQDFNEFKPNFAIDGENFADGFLFCQYMENCDWLQFRDNYLRDAVICAPNCKKNIVLCANQLEFVDIVESKRIIYANIRENPRLTSYNIKCHQNTQIII